MNLLEEFRIITCGLPGLSDPAIAIAGSRAGAIGGLDLQYSADPSVAEGQIEQTGRYTKNDFAVRVNGDAKSLLHRILSHRPSQWKLILLSGDEPKTLPMQVRFLRELGLSVLVEAVSLEEATGAEKAGAQGIIAKGNEAGGRVSEETTFILLQRFLRHLRLPIYAQGGIGLHTAAACRAAGAAGIVLDAQLSLTRESPIPEDLRAKMERMDGSETVCLGEEIGRRYRFYAPPGSAVLEELRREETEIATSKASRHDQEAFWREKIAKRIGWDPPHRHLCLFGQDIAFARTLARDFVTVAGVIAATQEAIRTHIRVALETKPLGEHSAMAQSHGIRYPIVQGPMAQVSDVPSFVQKVAEEGALPFLALSWVEGEDLKAMLEETSQRLAGRPWGVGVLGFLAPDLYRVQMQWIKAYHPPYAMISGGGPDQAMQLEKEGISTYVHVPSPGLLRMFLDHGVRRFVFEGRESGGHVGPRSAFVLWESAIREMMEAFSTGIRPGECHVLFAGGIHDDLSSLMISAMAAPLAEKGVRIGVQVGSGYLFTEEAVATGAILEAYQEQLLNCNETVVLETNLGHANRCAKTPYAEAFKGEKRRLLSEGKTAEEITKDLDDFGRGRLRIASKGIDTRPDPLPGPGGIRMQRLSREEQKRLGLYLVGQVAALHSQTFTMKELHRRIAITSQETLRANDERQSLSFPSRQVKEAPSDVAIVGMACSLPKAPSLKDYWENILRKVCAIVEIPKERWDWQWYYHQDPKAKDRICSKWGAFLDGIVFDPLKYGIPPSSLRSIDPMQLLTLEVVGSALEDAGYSKRPFARDRTSVIFGISGSSELAQLYGFRASLPMFFGGTSQDICKSLEGILPEWTEDSFPGILVNVTAGRIANRFNLGGTNFTVDAACASSLAAICLGVRDLERHGSDMVIAGGADTMQNPFAYLCFSKTQALSSQGAARCLDENADGIVLGEGIAAVVMKRLADAERDGDRIYAVIKGIGSGSDGRQTSLTAPAKKGQADTLKRAYLHAGVSPSTVGLLEAHSTGTTVGDRVEIEAASEVFHDAGARPGACAVGSVKSMIGHTKSAAGIAGLIKCALSLDRKVLPPTLGVQRPNAALRSPQCPFYVNTEPRPWVRALGKAPRRAAVSAFGFGGTNFHVVLEEYEDRFTGHDRSLDRVTWPGELFIWRAGSRDQLVSGMKLTEEALAKGSPLTLKDLAASLCPDREHGEAIQGHPIKTLAIVASSLEDLKQKLEWGRAALTGSQEIVNDPRGIYFAEHPLATQGKVAFLFPGQGSQYVNMLRELAIHLPEVRGQFEKSDALLAEVLPEPLSRYIFPPPAFTDGDDGVQRKALAQTSVAQPAIGTASLALFHLLKKLGIFSDMMAGHSYGEYVALCAAGVVSEEDLMVLSEARGRFCVEAGGSDSGTMAAVNAGVEAVEGFLKGKGDVWVANSNAPKQTIISGTRSAVAKAVDMFRGAGVQAVPIPVACAFHSPIISGACRSLEDYLSRVSLRRPQLKVFSNTTCRPYPEEPRAIAQQLIRHLTSPVLFMQEIEAMYGEGARIFVEVGPGKVLTGLVGQILKDKPHLSVASNQPSRPDFVQLHHLLAQLASHGVAIRMSRLYPGETGKGMDIIQSGKAIASQEAYKTAWWVNGFRARPYGEVSGEKTGDLLKPIPLVQEKESLSPSGTAVDRGANASGSFPMEMPEREAPCRETEKRTTEPLDGAVSANAMVLHQRLMRRFLDTQKTVMTAYAKSLSETNGLTALRQEPSQAAVSRGRDGVKGRPGSAPRDGASAESKGHERAVQGTPSERELSPRELSSLLLRIVSERTGYPQDALDLNLDLEADLGIDSIKRIEILDALMRSCSRDMETDMERLVKIKNLRGMIEWMCGRSRDDRKTPAEEGRPISAMSSGRLESLLKPEGMNGMGRYLLFAEERPLRRNGLLFPSTGVVLITDDGRGIAQKLTDSMRDRGQAVALARLDSDEKEQGPGLYRAPFDSPEGAKRLVDLIGRRQGRITGMVHLLPLRDHPSFSHLDFHQWKKILREEVKSLFYFIKSLEQDLATAGKGQAHVIAATCMGGKYASGPSGINGSFLPGQGGIAGIMKTLALERPDLMVKCIDVSSNEETMSLAKRLFTEIENGADHPVEIGYDGSKRITLIPKAAPLTERTKRSLSIDSGWVILATGGARGITGRVTLELAKRYRPTLILLGRSVLTETEESPEIAGLNTEKEIKSALISKMRNEGRSFTLPQVEALYRRMVNGREMRHRLSEMERAGATVRYYPCDVRDQDAFGDLIDLVYKEFGRLDGVIHGAGINEDKLISDKSADSFDRVFDTKADSAFLLMRKLRPDLLKFLVFFSSVAGRFGNRGQIDYAAANEVLNKLAVFLDRQWPGRVLAINWGPWAGSGMVTPELEKEFGRRGVALIDPSVGPALLDMELGYGEKGEVEITVGNVNGWTKES